MQVSNLTPSITGKFKLRKFKLRKVVEWLKFILMHALVMALLPGYINFFMVSCTVSEIEINEALIWNTRFFGHALKV